MKHFQIILLALLLAFTSVQAGIIANFTSAEGWIDGDPTVAGQPTTGLAFVSTQGTGNYVVDSTAGTLSVPSQSFLRALYSIDGNAMDIATGAGIQLDYGGLDIAGEGAFTGNRILAELGLSAPSDPTNSTTGGVDPGGTAGFGIQVRSNGTNYTIDAGAFGNNAPVDTGVALTTPFDLSLRYSEIAANNVLMEVFVNGAATPVFSQTDTTGTIAGSNLYGFINSSQGTGATPAGSLVFDSLAICPIPEPSIVSFLGLSILGFISLFRKRRCLVG